MSVFVLKYLDYQVEGRRLHTSETYVSCHIHHVRRQYNILRMLVVMIKCRMISVTNVCRIVLM